MRKIDENLIQTVDDIISEYACYNPIELFIRQGLLCYEDYERLRDARISAISDKLSVSVEEGLNILEEAAAYVTKLGFKAEKNPLWHHHYHTNDNLTLLLSLIYN